jgi:hypothetical protein
MRTGKAGQFLLMMEQLAGQISFYLTYVYHQIGRRILRLRCRILAKTNGKNDIAPEKSRYSVSYKPSAQSMRIMLVEFSNMAAYFGSLQN